MCKSELKWRSYSHLKVIAPRWKMYFALPFLDAKILHHLSQMQKFCITLFHLWNFHSHLFSLAKILHDLFLLRNFHSTISHLRNVIFRYFAPTPLDFYLKIFCVITYFPCNQLKIFRISNWGVANISLYIS